jgi:hypothetical protein
MNKPISIALVVAGVILAIYGANSSNSIGSGFSRFFTGAPTDKALWLMIGGGVAFAIGIAGFFRSSNAR